MVLSDVGWWWENEAVERILCFRERPEHMKVPCPIARYEWGVSAGFFRVEHDFGRLGAWMNYKFSTLFKNPVQELPWRSQLNVRTASERADEDDEKVKEKVGKEWIDDSGGKF